MGDDKKKLLKKLLPKFVEAALAGGAPATTPAIEVVDFCVALIGEIEKKLDG